MYVIGLVTTHQDEIKDAISGRGPSGIDSVRLHSAFVNRVDQRAIYTRRTFVEILCDSLLDTSPPNAS